MTASPATPLFTATEIRSSLPSGWNITPGSEGRVDPRTGRWSIDVYDGADNTWTIEVEPAAGAARLEALRAAIDRVQRKGLGRKSVWIG
jgi:hypothetical protein